MNIIEAIKEFQTGKYEYMVHPYGYTCNVRDNALQIVDRGTNLIIKVDILDGWEMGPKKKEKKTGWINIYRDCSGQQIFPTKEMARDAAWKIPTDTIEITWYE